MQGQQGQKRPWEQEDLRTFLNKKAKKNAGKECGEKARDRGTSGQGAGNQSSSNVFHINNYNCTQNYHFTNCTFHNDRGTSGQGAGNQRSGNVFHINNYSTININNS